MEEQEAVNPVELTTETESAPVETNTEVEPNTSADTIIEPETDDRKTVPYDRFATVNAEKAQAIAEKQVMEVELARLRSSQASQPQYQAPAEEIPQLDPDAAKAVDFRAKQIASQMIEQQRQNEFMAKHQKEFASDPLLEAAFAVEFNRARSEGRFFDRDTALETAKAHIDSRLKPQVEAAIKEGVKEGQDIARMKQQLGAVGESAKVVDKTDAELTSDELAKKYKLPHLS